jgi:hypothetical protein
MTNLNWDPEQEACTDQTPDLTDAQYEAAKKSYGPQWGEGILVRRPNEKEWVPANTPQGRKIITQAYGSPEKCQQGQALYSR